MSLEDLIAAYGYAAVGIGAFLEGETVLILGGFAAHRGYLELPWVIVSAFLGTIFGDQLYFYIGRIKGKALIEKRPLWKSRSEKLIVLLDRHGVWVVLGFRFLYGLRTVAPVIIGATNISPGRFLVLNILGAFCWSLIIGIMGYVFGNTLELVLGDIKKYESLLFALLVVAGVSIRLIYVRKKSSALSKKGLGK